MTKTGLNVYELSLFLPREDGLYEKYEEEHLQRAYSLETIQRLLSEAGMEFLTAYDAFTRQPPRQTVREFMCWPGREEKVNKQRRGRIKICQII